MWFFFLIIFALVSQSIFLCFSKSHVQEFCFGFVPALSLNIFLSRSWFLIIPSRLKFSLFEILPSFPNTMQVDFHSEKFWHSICRPSKQYHNLYSLHSECMSPNSIFFFPEATGSRDAKFCTTIEHGLRNTNKTDNDISITKKQMTHINKVLSEQNFVSVSICASLSYN